MLPKELTDQFSTTIWAVPEGGPDAVGYYDLDLFCAICPPETALTRHRVKAVDSQAAREKMMTEHARKCHHAGSDH